MAHQSTSKCLHFGSRPSLRGMGGGPDVMSNREHDDSVRIFPCFYVEGWESSLKNGSQVDFGRTTNLQEVLSLMTPCLTSVPISSRTRSLFFES